jgi:hypothetical protein
MHVIRCFSSVQSVAVTARAGSDRGRQRRHHRRAGCRHKDVDCGLKICLLRSLPAPHGPVVLSGCLSSSLPPSITSGRFATFFYLSA